MFSINQDNCKYILNKIDNFLINTNTLNEYFENSSLPFDVNETYYEYMGEQTLECYLWTTYFDKNEGELQLNYNENLSLYEQYHFLATDVVLSRESHIKILEKILTILYKSTLNKNEKEIFLKSIFDELEKREVLIEKVKENIFIMNNRVLDEGSYCSVHYYNKNLVYKKLKKEYIGTQHDQRLKYEFENMKKLEECPYILDVIDYCDEEKSYLMERADDCLYNILRDKKLILEEKVKIILDILSGMKAAHDLGIIHRDLHWGNILNIHDKFVISDFGLAKDINIERSLKSSNSMKSSNYFTDPICIQKRDFTLLDYKSDIFSLGRIIEVILSSNKDETSKFEYIISKATASKKEDRYNNIDEIIKDIDILKKKLNSEEIIEKIKKGIADVETTQYILEILNENKIVYLIHKCQLKNFHLIILKIPIDKQVKILEQIRNILFETYDFKFEDYDIFSNIAYKVYMETSFQMIKNICFEIVEHIAEEINRFDSRRKLEKMEKIEFF